MACGLFLPNGTSPAAPTSGSRLSVTVLLKHHGGVHSRAQRGIELSRETLQGTWQWLVRWLGDRRVSCAVILRQPGGWGAELPAPKPYNQANNLDHGWGWVFCSLKPPVISVQVADFLR